MSVIPDTTVVDLHRWPCVPVRVERVAGQVWRIARGDKEGRELRPGDCLYVGDTIALNPQSELEAGFFRFQGGEKGSAHALIKESAFRPLQGRKDVPRLLLQLEQIEEEMVELGGDVLAVRCAPETAFEKALSAEFAFANLVREAAIELPEDVAREQGALPLFVNEETSFVAVTDLTVGKLKILMETLQRPVSPHMVESSVLDVLIDKVWG